MPTEEGPIIAAIATPPGRSALAVLRVSGAGAIALVSCMLPALADVTPEHARRLFHDFARDERGEPIDEVTAIPYFAPKSYTAEEMVEIICHGGFLAARTILNRLISLGARIAEPGEFTRRAFMNGRISLSQAEAVAAAIEAKSELALKAAARNLKGELYNRIDDIRSGVADLLTVLEAEIDFSEEEIDKTPVAQIREIIAAELAKAGRVLQSYDFGRGLNVGYRVAIVGKANVGKSSLLNALLQRERAIVTDIPGTTRDTLTEWIEIEGFPVLLTDTAGLRDEGSDMVEAIGMQRTRSEMERSDLVLFMVDSSVPLTDEDLAIYRSLGDRPRLVLANKSDLIPSTQDSRLKTHDSYSALSPQSSVLFVSALTGAGLDDLRARIAAHFHLDVFSLDTALLATERQYQAMKKAHETLAQALAELGQSPTAEVISLYLRETLDHLGELVGETTTEDILNNIFGRFCVGK
jgi:tRNA modification GTPase